MIYLLATTVVENNLKKLDDNMFNEGGNPSVLVNNTMTDADAVIEWAARVCYDSNSKFGNNPNFIKHLIDIGHMDVLEHATATFGLSMDNIYNDVFENLLKLKNKYPYLFIGQVLIKGATIYLTVSGNLRAWYDSLNDTVWQDIITPKDYNSMCKYLYLISPSIFSNYYYGDNLNAEKLVLESIKARGKKISIEQIHAPKVMLLARSVHIDDSNMHDNEHFTIQLDGVTRAFTHQHVRHRVLSNSQSSQRYIDMENFEYVTPIKFDAVQRAIFDRHMENTKKEYLILRKHGVKKEDARAVIPNAAVAKIVTSGYIDGWINYHDQRSSKAAQLEIRVISEKIFNLQMESNLLHERE